MKKILSIVVFLTVFFISNVKASTFSTVKAPLLPGDTLSISFAVNGNASCKSSIEGSVTANAGVLSASWDATSKIITISYISSQIKKSDLYTFLALAGYDNAELRAKDAVYAALPANCQYTRDPDNE
jgi:hypothetical protein